MELTILLAKVFGIYLIFGGIAIWWRHRFFIPVLGNFAHDPLLRLIVGTIEVVGGLFLVLQHNVWESAASSLVSFFGWMLLIEGALYMVLSDKTVERMYAMVNRPVWYVFGGIFAILTGLYLTAFGFGWLS